MSIVTSPFPPLQNFPIDSDFYVPNFFVISALTLGQTTAVTTSVDHNFVIGQLVRFLIPDRYKTRGLNEKKAYVVSVPSSTQVVCDIESVGLTPFVSSPYVSSITNISQSSPGTVTATNSFRIGDLIKFSDVEGMTEVNGNSYNVLTANSTSFTINVDTTSFTAYTGSGTATFAKPYPLPYIAAIGDVNSGAINMDISSQQLYINGSFRNISPV